MIAAGAAASAALMGIRIRSLSRQIKPPVASTTGGRDVFFGKFRDENRGDNPMSPPKITFDPYFWLRDDKRKDPKVISYLEQENKYTEFMTTHLNADREAIYADLLSHVKETDEGIPYPYGNKPHP
jgi:hypothetical protein